ncbi:MAG: hypothetical protein CMJ58_13375 [Planctomycetaceae bacterium]|nr:hypothetical protein [Planctomycetaceae bacterium]
MIQPMPCTSPRRLSALLAFSLRAVASPALLAAVAVTVATLAQVQAAALQTWQIEVSYDRLVAALGDDVPDGAGVSVSQVEAAANLGSASLNYNEDPFMPSPESAGEWAAGEINFVDVRNLPDAMSGGEPVYSSHSTNIGALIYGNSKGLATGVDTVYFHEVSDWLSNVLRYNSTQGPVAQNYRVQNHSWVGAVGTSVAFPDSINVATAQNVAALQRYDYLLDTANNGEGMTGVVGVFGAAKGVPYLMSHSYNAIAAGMSNGNNSDGLTLSPATNSYGPGRVKPDVVAPWTTHSGAAGMVSSAATILHDTLSGTPGANAEVVKSVILAGASKRIDSVPDYEWDYGAATVLPSGAVQVTQAMESRRGVGELDVWNNHLIASGGQYAGSQTQPASTIGSNGWDYGNLKGQPTAGSVYYTLEIPEGTTVQELSIVLAWHIEVEDPTEAGFDAAAALQNLDLRLYDTTGGFILNPATLIAESVSTVENVEHLYFDNTDSNAINDLASGTYTIEVAGAGGWDYGLAWRTSTLFDQPSADFNGDGMIDGGDFLIWQVGNGMLQGAAHGQGDADGDGDVDNDDLDILNSTYGTAAVAASSASSANATLAFVSAIPEPTSWLLAAIAIGVGAGVARRRAA